MHPKNSPNLVLWVAQYAALHPGRWVSARSGGLKLPCPVANLGLSNLSYARMVDSQES